MMATAYLTGGTSPGTVSALLAVSGLIVGLGAGLAIRSFRIGPARSPAGTSAADVVVRAGTDDPSPRGRREPAGPRQPEGDLSAERDVLVRACIRARDLAASAAIRQVIGDALTKAGVIEDDPTGQRFDPERHRSVGVTPTGDPALDDTIASAERVGYLDRGRQLRPAEVILFSLAQGW